MKNTLTVALLCLAATYLRAQDLKTSEVPESVKQAFAKKFPAIQKVQWSKEGEKEFEAEYKVSGAEQSSNFDQTGKWLVTETEIKSSQLPVSVQGVLKKDYIDYRIEEVEKAETSSNEVFYEVTLEKGEINLEIKFSPEGKIISKEEKKEDKD